METFMVETTDGEFAECVSLETAAYYGLDDLDACGDKSAESMIDVILPEDGHE